MSDGTKEPVNVYQVLAIMVDQLAGLAWQKMGLQHDMVTGQIAKDPQQAKVAIDACADLCKHLDPELDSDDRRRLQSLLNDLRINFLDQSKGDTL